MKNTDWIDLSVIGGQKVDITPAGIFVKCCGGTSKIEVLKSGRINLYAEKEIQISVVEDISVVAKQWVRMLDGKTIQLKSAQGGSLTLDEDGNITVTGVETHMN